MVDWLEYKYVNMVAPRLQMFKQKGKYLWNFRCPICGDSQKNRYKARGYLYRQKSGIFFKCHNCNYGTTLGNLIKQLDPLLYKEYVLERFKEGEGMGKAHKPHAEPVMKFETPVFDSEPKTLLDELFRPLSRCSDDNPAVKFARNRLLPESKFDRLYFIDDMQLVEQLSEKYKDRIIGTESRLGIPHYSLDGTLIGMTCRALENHSLKYVAINLRDSPMIYGMDTIRLNKPIIVVEGSLDALFLENSLAMNNADLKRIGSILPHSDTRLAFDNQPRHKDVLRAMDNAIKMGMSVCFWPDRIKGKDINEMVLNGYDPDDIQELILTHSYNGLKARGAMINWRKL